MIQEKYSVREVGDIVERVLFLKQAQDQDYEARFGGSSILSVNVTEEALRDREEEYDQNVPEDVRRELNQVALFSR